MAFVVLALVFVGLKALEVAWFASVSWWWLLLPLGLAVVWWQFADSSGYTQRKEMDKMAAKKEARRQRALEALGQGGKRRR